MVRGSRGKRVSHLQMSNLRGSCRMKRTNTRAREGKNNGSGGRRDRQGGFRRGRRGPGQGKVVEGALVKQGRARAMEYGCKGDDWWSKRKNAPLRCWRGGDPGFIEGWGKKKKAPGTAVQSRHGRSGLRKEKEKRTGAPPATDLHKKESRSPPGMTGGNLPGRLNQNQAYLGKRFVIKKKTSRQGEGEEKGHGWDSA